MYRTKMWDEDKWDIHSASHGTSKYGSIIITHGKDEKQYREHAYSSEKSPSSDYIRREEDKQAENSGKDAFDDVEEAKDEAAEELKEEDIQFKAAKQIFDEDRQAQKKSWQKKDVNSIEEAIKKAVEEEKKVIVMD